MKSFCSIPWFAGMAMVLVGCYEGPGPTATEIKTVPVSGTLTYEGRPLEGFQVTFLSTEGSRAATGVTDTAGKFTLGTNDVGDGAPPGNHQVAVVWVGPPIDAEAGMEQIIDDPALLPKPPVEIPQKYSNPDTSGLSQNVPEEGLSDLKIDLTAKGPQE